MANLSIHHPWALIFGVLGNVISFMVFLAPLTTFYRVYKKKSTEAFQSIPYVVALFSCMMWMYYAFLKGNEFLLITINSFGCAIETLYIAMFIAYAPRKARIYTSKLVMLLNIALFGLIFLLTQLLSKGSQRVVILGWICVGFSTSVFAAPLSVIRLVIRTKSVEFMPFNLSLFLTISAILWFSYGFFQRDVYIAFPNILGFIFGILQMILYMIYRVPKKGVEGQKLPKQVDDLAELGATELNQITTQSEKVEAKDVSQDELVACDGYVTKASPSVI